MLKKLNKKEKQLLSVSDAEGSCFFVTAPLAVQEEF